MANIGSAEFEFKSKDNGLKSAFTNIDKDIATTTKEVTKFNSSITNTNNTFKSFSSTVKNTAGFLGLTIGITAFVNGLKNVTNAAISFESAFAGIRKTVDATEKEFALISEQFKNLSKEIPTTVEELLRVGELGGQLGVAKEDLEDFTKTIAALGVSTNLTEEEAATSFARIANIFQTPISEIENLGSAVVALGNNFATSESEIVAFANRIASSGQLAGLSSADISAIGAAFSSVGIQAEAGGTAVQTTLLKLTEAVANGGADLENFARLSGLGASEFSELWRNEPIKAFDLFVKGLAKSGDQGSAILDELVGGSSQIKRGFLSVAAAGDLLERAVQTANQAYTENVALSEEAEKRYATTESQLQLLANRFNLVKIVIGNFLKEVAVPLGNFFVGLAEALIANSGGIKEFATTISNFAIPKIKALAEIINSLRFVILGAVTAFASFRIITSIVTFFSALNLAIKTSSVLLGTSGLTRAISSAIASLTAFKVASGGTFLLSLKAGLTSASVAVRAFGASILTALGPIGLAVGAISAVIGAFVLLIAKEKQVQRSLESLKEGFNAFSSETTTTFIQGIDDIIAKQDELSKAKFFERADNAGVALSFGTINKSVEELTGGISRLDQAQAEYNQSTEEFKNNFVEFGVVLGENENDLQEWVAGIDLTTEKGSRLFNEKLGTMEQALNQLSTEAVNAFQIINNGSDGSFQSTLASLQTFEDALRSTAKEQGKTSSQIQVTVDEMLNVLRDRFAEAGDLAGEFTIGLYEGLTASESLNRMKEAGRIVTDEVLIAASVSAANIGELGEAATLLYAAGIISEEQQVAFAAGKMSKAGLLAIVKTNEANQNAVAKSSAGVIKKASSAASKAQIDGDAITRANAEKAGRNIALGLAKGLKEKTGVFTAQLSSLAKVFNISAKSLKIPPILLDLTGLIDAIPSVETLQQAIDDVNISSVEKARLALDDFGSSATGAGGSIGDFAKSVSGGTATASNNVTSLVSDIEASFKDFGDTYRQGFADVLKLDKTFLSKRADQFQDGLKEVFDTKNLNANSISQITSQFESFLIDIDNNILAQLNQSFTKNLGSIGDLIGTIETSDFAIQDLFELPDTSNLIDTESWTKFWSDYQSGIEGAMTRLQELAKEQATFFENLRKDTLETTASLDNLEGERASKLAQIFSQEEQKLAELKKQLSESDSGSGGNAKLQQQINEQQRILRANADFRKGLELEIAEVTRRDNLDPIAKIAEDFEREKNILEERLNINKAFFDDTELKKPKQLADVISELKTLREGVKNEENQEYLDRLITEQEQRQTELDQAKTFLENANMQKMQIENQYQAFLAQTRANELEAFKKHLSANESALAANKSVMIQMFNQIASAARAAAQAAATAMSFASSGSRGASGSFASGGYTGKGGKFQPAGIVHKNEYVIPSHMVNKLKPTGMIGNLERMRRGLKGYSQGGMVGGGSSMGGEAPAMNKVINMTFNNTNAQEASTGVSGAELMFQLRPYLN